MTAKSFTVVLLVLGFGWGLSLGAEAAVTFTPGIYSPEDFQATPESVTVVSYGTDNQDTTTFRKPKSETLQLEVYELKPGVYRFVTDPAAKSDPVAMNSDVGEFNLANLVSDSGAQGILIRGTGAYPGATAISFGLLSEYPDIPKNTDGSFNYEKAATDFGYKLFTGRRYFEVNGITAVFENVAIGDHAGNNIGVIHTAGGGRTFLKDVWIHNVYDGIFFDDNAEAYFVNCIFHQTYEPWNTLTTAQDAGYFTDDWVTNVEPAGLGGTAYAQGVNLSEDKYPQLKGVILGNDIVAGYNINLFETEGANPQLVYLKNCTLVKHQIRDSNRLWRHNTGSGSGAQVVFEDCMILSLDNSPNTQIRLGSSDPDFFGNVYNTKFWNYASADAQLNLGGGGNWNIIENDPSTFDAVKVDSTTPGGLDITQADQLFRLDGRRLTTFTKGAVELTLAGDGGQIGYRLPAGAPAGPLPVATGNPVRVLEWSLY